MSTKYKSTVEIDANVSIILKKLAKQDDRSLTNYIRKVLTDHVTQFGTYTQTSSPTQIEADVTITEPKGQKKVEVKSDNEVKLEFATTKPKLKGGF
ncbi:MAG: hypothetical protein RR090_12770 [Niameybacter sp.]